MKTRSRVTEFALPSFYSTKNRPAILAPLAVVVTFLVIALALPSIGAAQSAEEIYQTMGYGYVFQLGPDTQSPRQVALYQQTESSLLAVAPGSLTDQGELFLGDSFLAQVSTDNGIQLHFPDHTVMDLEPMAALPEVAIDNSSADPESVFQVAWELVEEYCSLIPLVQVDWQQKYQDLRPRVSSETTPEELFDLLAEMLQPLNDSHTNLEAQDLNRDFNPGPSYPSQWMYNRVNDLFQVIVGQTDSGLESPLDGMFFGSMGDIGYLAVNKMVVEAEDERQWSGLFGTAVDTALASLSDKKALILDLRFNGGGSDQVSVALAKRFTDQTRLAYKKMVRTGAYDQFSDPVEIYYGPEGMGWGPKPVVVLTSRNSASATEVATLMLGDLPNVTLIGEPTHGIFSNAYPYSLPNGWQMTLSTEIYLSSQDINYEQKGYPVDQQVAWSEAALDQGRDNILEHAIAFLDSSQSGCTPDAATLCLQNGRFAVKAQWRDFEGLEGSAGAQPVNDEFGHFSFFSDTNVELAIKVLDGRDINDSFWVFVGSLSNVAFNITVTDTETGTMKTYQNALGNFASFGDVTAFPVNP